MPNTRYKVTCAICKKTFDNDYKAQHCKRFHTKYTAKTLPLLYKNQPTVITVCIISLLKYLFFTALIIYHYCVYDCLNMYLFIIAIRHVNHSSLYFINFAMFPNYTVDQYCNNQFLAVV